MIILFVLVTRVVRLRFCFAKTTGFTRPTGADTTAAWRASRRLRVPRPFGLRRVARCVRFPKNDTRVAFRLRLHDYGVFRRFPSGKEQETSRLPARVPESGSLFGQSDRFTVALVAERRPLGGREPDPTSLRPL